MKTIALFCTIIFIFAITTGVTNSSLAKEDNNNDAIRNILPNHCVFSGDYIQTKKISSLPTPLSSTGKLFFSCTHGLIWHNKTPFPESLIYTLDNLHFRKIENDPVIELDSQQHYYLAKFLLSLLGGDIKSIEQQFLIETTKSENHIKLIPTNDMVKKGLDSITIEKKQENKNELLFITIADKKLQTTALKIINITTYSKVKKDNIDVACSSALDDSIACDVLSSPQTYHVITSSN